MDQLHLSGEKLFLSTHPRFIKSWEEPASRGEVSWDMRVNARSHEPLPPVTNVQALLGQCASLFHLIDPQLGSYYETMLREGCFDLEERANKAHVGFSQPLEAQHLPFIFGHLASLPDVVTLLLHECACFSRV